MQIQRIQEQKRDHRHVASKNNEIVAVYKSRERRILRLSTDIGTRELRHKTRDPESRLRNRVRPRV